MVVGTSNFSDPNAIEKLEYYEQSNGQWYELSGEFGPATGFPMYDASSKFRVTFKTAGNYSFTASMKRVDNGEVLCSTDVDFTVHPVGNNNNNNQNSNGNTSGSGSSSKVPKTGDSTNMILWFVLMAVAGALIAATVIFGKKAKSNR